MQRPGRRLGAIAEQIRADRTRQRGVVDQDRKIFTGLLACAFPRRADLGRRIVRAVKDAVVGRVLGIGGFGRNDADFAVENRPC